MCSVVSDDEPLMILYDAAAVLTMNQPTAAVLWTPLLYSFGYRSISIPPGVRIYIYLEER